MILRPISHARRSIYRAMEVSENERFLKQTLNVKYFHECIICLLSAVCRKSPIIRTIANIADKSYLDPRPIRTIRNEWCTVTARFIRTDRITEVPSSLLIYHPSIKR